VQAARLGTVETIEDAGYSAKDLKRPGVQEELRALEAGEAKALVVAKLDRLSRSMLDFAALMATALKQNWALVALDCALDTSTPAGEAMANVLATFSQFERRLIGQRTKEALAAKRAAGVRRGSSADGAAADRPPHSAAAGPWALLASNSRGVEHDSCADGPGRQAVVRGDRTARPAAYLVVGVRNVR
jgi:DNA invertase Pin-like site-specific DNA recombinase